MEPRNVALHVRNPHSYMATLDAGEAVWLRVQLESFWQMPDNDLECVDNYRMCLRDEPTHEAAYEEAMDEGCCGSVDVQFGPSPLGRFYRYGFNYGH